MFERTSASNVAAAFVFLVVGPVVGALSFSAFFFAPTNNEQANRSNEKRRQRKLNSHEFKGKTTCQVGIVLRVAVWVVAMATFFVVVALLPKPANEATESGTVLNFLGIFVALSFVLGLFVFG